MKTARIWLVWAVLGVCALTVFVAMGWLTHSTIVESNARAAADARADLEERTRLALWRLDTLGAAIVLRENQYSVADYDSSVRSPFLMLDHPEVMLHFQVIQGGGLTSPENDELNAEEAGVGAELIAERKKRMAQLRELLGENPLPGDEWAQFSCAADKGEVTWGAVPKEPEMEQKDVVMQQLEDQANLDGNGLVQQKRRNLSYQTFSNANEYAQRAKAVQSNYEVQDAARKDFKGNLSSSLKSKKDDRRRQSRDEGVEDGFVEEIIEAEPVSVKTMRGAWLGGELFLLRKIVESGGERAASKMVQGVWMNAEALRKQLLSEAEDLLPNARLVPASGAQAAKNPMALVSFPFVLDRNEVISPASGAGLTAPLKAGWAAVLIAVIAAIVLVHGIIRLSERRASFVSAVTHELRTPLTTFRLYSDMLESGVVKEEKRSHYLNVLTREADRLSHLVENVLAFSRIERGNARSQVRTATLSELVETSRERMESRLEAAGMVLKVYDLPTLLCKVDTAAVEHILFNLVDNAAKYAADSDPARVELSAKRRGKMVEVSICDYGQGIVPAERVRIFQAFHKSAHDAAESQPGVGLGLALSRRLAKSMGGGLRCDDSASGACFVLSLPLAADS